MAASLRSTGCALLKGTTARVSSRPVAVFGSRANTVSVRAMSAKQVISTDLAPAALGPYSQVLEQSLALLAEVEGLILASVGLPPEQPLDAIPRSKAHRIPGELLGALEDTLEVIRMAREELAEREDAAAATAAAGPARRQGLQGVSAGQRRGSSGSGSGAARGALAVAGRRCRTVRAWVGAGWQREGGG
ncbi:hypothetical protein TSOC_013463 [Tetrabaena socialis]|uniref:Uncharacterized protein n=1 Tax=Tetrabaena socialis TaxID=47790 RepID=A0A2J7ZKB9_9CHLO|nr:hypothetical protein TSOC_013463 [Tetrabaena socialis]|eukprot:PNH00700.1 hypothetical protein TSOC_013463 [Tetrabaena socialis]